MSNLGMGVMINMLSGNGETVEAFKSAMGKKISKLSLEDDTLKFEFSDGTGIKVYDGGQSCCESRYMTTDDDLSDYVGGELKDMELREAPSVDTEYSIHGVQFLAVKTTKGNFTMSSHVEHNGYYGGFYIQIRKV